MFDNETLLSDAQALTASEKSTNYYACQAIGDMARGCDFALEVLVGTGADFTTEDETYNIGVEVATDDAFTSPFKLNSRTIPASELTAGSFHILPIPPSYAKYKNIRADYVLAGTSPSVTLTASIKPTHMCNTGGGQYHAPSGFTV